MDAGALAERIETAFGWRNVPDLVLAGILPGDELEEGSAPYGVGPWKEYNLTDFIYREIQGRNWKEVDVPVFTMPIHDLTREAFCYYLPAFLIYNLQTNGSFDTLDGYLTSPRISSLTSPTYNDDYKYEIRDQLTVEERDVVADYMSYLKDECQFTSEDIAFWKPAP